jgi:hypothetical protein
MLRSRIAPAPRPTVAYSAGRKVTLASLSCPHCAHELRAANAELHEDGDFRIVCCFCHVDIVAVEKL